MMAFGKKPVVCKLCGLGEAKSIYTQTNTLTVKNFKTVVQRRTDN